MLSGGLDSATVLNIALENYDVTALIFDYGQRHKFEISAAKKIAEIADIPIKLITIDLGQLEILLLLIILKCLRIKTLEKKFQ